jgi:hypothetical protein
MLKTIILIILSILVPFILWYLIFVFFTNTSAILTWQWGVKEILFIFYIGSISPSIEFFEEIDKY